MKKLTLLLFYLILLSGTVSMAQNQTFELKQSHETGIYRKGEKIHVFAFVHNGSNDSLKVVVRMNNDHIILKKAFLAVTDSVLIYEGSSSKPCSFIVEASLKDQKKGIGMIVDPAENKTRH